MAKEFRLSKSLKDQANRLAVKQIKSKSLSSYIKKAEKLKANLIQEFASHPVSKEIAEGVRSGNYSQTLGGYGNLFTFIGFEANDMPLEPIFRKLEEIKIDSRTSYGNLFINITMPTPEEIWQITPMPWQEGRSWAKGIESGISGLNFFLFLKKSSEFSRSGFGIQSEKRARSYFRYTPTSYISTLLKKYKTKFSSLASKDVDAFIEIL
jgi:hypothetical protein